MNPYVVGGAALVLAVGGFTLGWRVNGWKHDSEALLIERAAAKAGEAATTSATDLIKGLRPQFTTINKGIEREIRTETRYSSPDCALTPAAWGLLDRAYQAAGGEPFGSGASLPASGAAARSDPRQPPPGAP